VKTVRSGLRWVSGAGGTLEQRRVQLKFRPEPCQEVCCGRAFRAGGFIACPDRGFIRTINFSA